MSNNKDKKGSKSKYNLRNKKNDDKTKLKKGSRDPDSEPEEEESVRRIKHLQEFLNIKEDGVFGDKTKKAVEKFQSENNLEITGKTDAATLKAMNKEIDEKST